MEKILQNKEKILKSLAWVCLAGLIILVAGIAVRGKMFDLWYNSVLVVCALLVLAVVGFWVYAGIKGFDNVLVNEKRGGTDPLEDIEIPGK